MRYIRNISDNQNKSGDTDNIFRFNLLQDDDIFNFGDYPISINIANSSGYILSMVPEKEFGNSVLKLDFNDQSLKSLTPDNYLLEVEVKFPDGTTATFPTKGGMPFSVNSNLKKTAGHLVPTVTFDEVLNAVDEKVNNYLATVVKGDKGDTGVVDTAKDYTWTGTNTFNKKIIAPAGVQGNADTATIAGKVSDATVVHTDSSGSVLARSIDLLHTYPYIDFHFGRSTADYTTRIIEDTEGVLSVYKAGFTKGTIWVNVQGNLNGNADTATKLQTPRKINGTNFDGTTDINVNAANDSNIVHNTGTETIAGDKTFTGKNTFTGQTSFWFKQIQWTSGIMQGTWYIQRMGNFVFARFEKSQNTGTGGTSLSLPIGYRPINNWILDTERGQAGINGNGTVYIGTAYADNTSMTFVYPTNDVWPTA